MMIINKIESGKGPEPKVKGEYAIMSTPCETKEDPTTKNSFLSTLLSVL